MPIWEVNKEGLGVKEVLAPTVVDLGGLCSQGCPAELGESQASRGLVGPLKSAAAVAEGAAAAAADPWGPFNIHTTAPQIAFPSLSNLVYNLQFQGCCKDFQNDSSWDLVDLEMQALELSGCMAIWPQTMLSKSLDPATKKQPHKQSLT
jgi:hypothetical protein